MKIGSRRLKVKKIVTFTRNFRLTGAKGKKNCDVTKFFGIFSKVENPPPKFCKIVNLGNKIFFVEIW